MLVIVKFVYIVFVKFEIVKEMVLNFMYFVY